MALAATPPERRSRTDAPDRYIVVQGDTLWGIAGRFLKNPWHWPEIWKMNQEQIRNPHRIYPGDVLVLDRSAQEARLRMRPAGDRETLSPQVRVEPLAPKPVPTIPPSVIEPFLSKPLVVGADGARLGAAHHRDPGKPRRDRGRHHRLCAGLTQDKGRDWQIFRRGDPLVDPGDQGDCWATRRSIWAKRGW